MLNYYDWSDRVSNVMKTKQDYDVIDRTGIIYAENETQLSWLIKSGAIWDKPKRTIMWRIAQVKTILNYCDWSNQVPIVTKTR